MLAQALIIILYAWPHSALLSAAIARLRAYLSYIDEHRDLPQVPFVIKLIRIPVMAPQTVQAKLSGLNRWQALKSSITM